MNAPQAISNALGVIRQGGQLLEVPIAPAEAEKMKLYIEMLLEWNLRTNLTALTNPLDIAVLHFLDSLTVFKVVPRFAELRVLDVGSGAGFPGMVMKIMDETLFMTLLDRNPKKIVFMKEVARELGLAKITFANKKIEALLEGGEPRRFDLVVSRALSSATDFFDRLHKVLEPNGCLVRMGGPASVHDQLLLKHFHKPTWWEGVLPFSNSFRRVLLYQKRD